MHPLVDKGDEKNAFWCSYQLSHNSFDLFLLKKRTKSFRMPELSIDILFQHFEFERQQFSIERYLVYPLIPHGFTLIDHFFLSLFYSSPPHSQTSTHTKTEMILIIVFFPFKSLMRLTRREDVLLNQFPLFQSFCNWPEIFSFEERKSVSFNRKKIFVTLFWEGPFN